MTRVFALASALALGGSLVAATVPPTTSAEPEPAGRGPFLRDVTTGYLLRCFFLSPQPYCWTREDCLLSGWEVDRRGGSLAFQPNCHYPEGFGFHSDWFKLVDTRTNAAVVLAHQIAHQTNGTLTLEFRFRLPVPMEGARWQLRDLDQTAVGLVTTNDTLCLETAAGRAIPLSRLDLGRDYGVRVVADLDAQTADVAVDGAWKVREAAFVRPVRSIDFVRVETGGAATGELFLNPVNVFKGYRVNETFVACAPDTAPADWELVQTRVEAFECGTRPDIYSLKLAAAAGRGALARRTFAPLRSRTVFTCRFLVPEPRDGVTVGLEDGTAGVRLVTRGGDLCGLDADSRPVPLVRHFRTNLWYTLKVLADPQTGTADWWVNGKSVAARATFASKSKAFEAVRFETGPGTVAWIDDVQVYPWRDYPEDYVPEPKPVAANSGLLLGVQSCNLWREGTAYAGWDYVRPYRHQREPYLGWYDEGHPEATDWEIKWQVEHGIGFEQHCWYRPNNAIGHPIKDGVLDHGLIEGLFNARYSHLKKFTIMYTNEGAGETDAADWRAHLIPYWIEYFFKDPRYLKLDGRPVFAIYHLDHFTRMFGGVEGARQAIRTLRDEVAAAGFPGIVLLMEDRTADPARLRTLKAVGADACYAYTWGTPDAAVQRARNLAQRDGAAAAGLASLTSLSMGWDREAWGVKEGGWLPAQEYEALANWARDEFIPTLADGSLGRQFVMLANWNEFGEGHFLMPSTLAGFGYLEALRAVFTAGGLHQDARPNAGQRARFTVLYPRD